MSHPGGGGGRACDAVVVEACIGKEEEGEKGAVWAGGGEDE